MSTETATALTKKCPFCAEEIQQDAIKCKHCLTMLHGSEKKRFDCVVLDDKKKRQNWWFDAGSEAEIAAHLKSKGWSLVSAKVRAPELTKKCPKCKSIVPHNADRCKFCRHRFGLTGVGNSMMMAGLELLLFGFILSLCWPFIILFLGLVASAAK